MCTSDLQTITVDPAPQAAFTNPPADASSLRWELIEVLDSSDR